MIDNFALFVSHGLILLACWRLLWRVDLDDEHRADPRDDFRAATRRNSPDA